MPGVKIRFWPSASALLIAWALSEGLAIKKVAIGIEWPGVWPPVHVAPEELNWTSGTKTLKWFIESTYRNGFSRDSGLVDRVVYGGVGNAWAGAPTTPANTWFQTALLQPPRLLFLTRYCCCVPLTTLRENCESAMKPPLA